MATDVSADRVKNRLLDIFQASQRATAEPWYAVTVGDGDADLRDVQDSDGVILLFDARTADAEFIADARSTVPNLASALLAVLLKHPQDFKPTCDGCGEQAPCSTVCAIADLVL